MFLFYYCKLQLARVLKFLKNPSFMFNNKYDLFIVITSFSLPNIQKKIYTERSNEK